MPPVLPAQVLQGARIRGEEKITERDRSLEPFLFLGRMAVVGAADKNLLTCKDFGSNSP